MDASTCRPPARAPTTRSCSATTTRRCPTRARPGSRTACTAPAGSTTTPRSAWTDRRLDRPAAARQRALRAARRHVHPGGHLRRGHRAARPPRRPRRRPGRAAAGQRVQRRTQLGLRRRLLVRAARGVRRPRRAEAVRRRLPPARPGGGPRRRLQPFRPVGGLRADVRSLPGRGRRNTWGRSVNLDGPHSDEVRRYIVDSVLMWLRDYHVDGLRLDAVHALRRPAAPIHLLEELAVEVEALSTHLGRPLSLIAESDLNDPRLITPREAGGYGLHAQWDDDVHHALHTLLTGERQGYYADFGSLESPGRRADRRVLPRRHLVVASAGGVHGRPVDRTRVPGHRFVAYLQNHDQIGNRAIGDRLSATLSPGPAAGRRDAAVHRAVHADAVHGRGVGRQHAVAVLHQPPRAGAGRRRGDRPPPRVRRARLARGRRARPAGPADLRCAPGSTGPSWTSRSTPRSWSSTAADRAAPQPRRTSPTHGWTRSRYATATSSWSCAAATVAVAANLAGKPQRIDARRCSSARSCWPPSPAPPSCATASSCPPSPRSSSRSNSAGSGHAKAGPPLRGPGFLHVLTAGVLLTRRPARCARPGPPTARTHPGTPTPEPSAPPATTAYPANHQPASTRSGTPSTRTSGP